MYGVGLPDKTGLPVDKASMPMYGAGMSVDEAGLLARRLVHRISRRYKVFFEKLDGLYHKELEGRHHDFFWA
ncbi:MAG: hypothetical protein AAF355_11885 [Myxococcota bacterium]